MRKVPHIDNSIERERESYRNFIGEERKIGEIGIAVTATPRLGSTASILQEIANHQSQIVLALLAQAQPSSDDLTSTSTSTSNSFHQPPIPCRHAHFAIHDLHLPKKPRRFCSHRPDHHGEENNDDDSSSSRHESTILNDEIIFTTISFSLSKP